MGITKRLNPDNIFLFLFLVIFPFGQVIRIGILQPLDIVVGLGALYAISRRFERPGFFKYLESFLFIAFFSWVLSIFIFHDAAVLYGLLYLVRLAAYFYFLIYVWNFVKKSMSNRELLVNSLLSVSAISAAFGWLQFFTFSSLKPLFVWGWDEHLYRLVGTFLDPAYLGLIIVFGLLISIIRFIDTKNWRYLLLSAFMLISLAFTYSRASYLALFTGLLVIAYYKKLFIKLALLVVGFILLVLILPTAQNHILSFTRSFSAIARISNYSETFEIFKTSPVLGVGYDNLCLAKAQTTGFLNTASHSCSGSDSSILFLLATAGVVGLIVLVYAIWSIRPYLPGSPFHLLLVASFIALIIHSLFSNSLVYPWILGYLIILLTANLRSKVER